MSPNTCDPQQNHAPTVPYRLIMSFVALALLGASCASSDSSGTSAAEANSSATTTASDESASTTTSSNSGDSTSANDNDKPNANNATAANEVCASNQRASGAYIVTDIPANDPDGGLVARTGPGTANDKIFVIATDNGVWPGSDAADCRLSDGNVWWRAVNEGGEYWVNSSYLGKYQGPGNRTAAGTEAALCDAYQLVVESQETDIWPTAAMIQLDVELGGHPAGVSQALTDLVNGDGLAYDTIEGYVGPICAGNSATGQAAWFDQPLADIAQACWAGTTAACDELTSSNMSPEGAVAHALVEAVMSGDTATVRQLSSAKVAESMWEGPFTVEDSYGLASIQLDGTSFSFDPFPTGATTCQLDAAGIVASCTYHS